MSVIIVALCWVVVRQENSKDQLRVTKDIQIAREQARADACYESQVLYVKEKEKFSQEMLFKYLELNKKVNETEVN